MIPTVAWIWHACSAVSMGDWSPPDTHKYIEATEIHTQTQISVYAQSCLILSTPWTIVHQAPLSVEFSRQEYWSGLPFPLPGNFPNPEIKLTSPESPVLAGGVFTTDPPGKPPTHTQTRIYTCPHRHKDTHTITHSSTATEGPRSD